ncbi:MAG: hypothetical protein ACYDDU_07340 [Dermatophilaceae bacterium]
MTYTPTPGLGRPLLDEDRSVLGEMESIKIPTPYAKGLLDSLRMRATTDDDRARCATIAAKWETSK